MAHNELITYAKKWLESRCQVVITELASCAGEQPDAVGFDHHHSVLVECKASRSDFLSDKKKYFRRCPEVGMGSERYYLCPEGLLNTDELPHGWGLIEVKLSGKMRIKKKSGKYFKKSYQKELALMISAMRRIGQNAPAGINVNCYTYETKRRATIGIRSEREEKNIKI